jgi:drug/metabolite transporter (DMT)-like permease
MHTHSMGSAPPATSSPFEIALLIALTVLWAFPYALTKISLETIPPITLVAVRVSLAAVVLWTIIFAQGREIPTRPHLMGRFFMQGCLGALIPYVLTTWGQQTTDSAVAAVLNSTSPVFVCLIIAFWTKHEPIPFGRLFGVLLGLGGVVLIAGVAALGGVGREIAGQSAIVLATFSLALAAIHGRAFADVAPEVTAAGMLTCAAVVLVPTCFFVEAPLDCVPSIPSIMALLVNAIAATALGFVLYFRLIGTVGSMGVASVAYLKPAVGVFIGCTLLGEPFSWTLASGLAAILIGVAAINHYGRSTRAIVPRAATARIAAR